MPSSTSTGNSSASRTTPQGTAELARSLPFLGTLVCTHSTLVAGSWDEIGLTYTVGASGIADGARLKIAFKFYSDWALFQNTNPSAANYVTAEVAAAPRRPGQSASTVQAIKISFDQKGHERPFQKALILDIVDGYLSPGDRIEVRLGDRRGGGPGTRVQTFAEAAFVFRGYVDPLGTSRFANIPGDVEIDVVPGPIHALSISTPRIVRQGEVAPTRIRAFDRWGNCCRSVGAKLNFSVTAAGKIFTDTYSFPEHGWAVVALPVSTSEHAGDLALAASLEGVAPAAEVTATLTVDPSFPTPRAWFADLHVHSDDTVGINSTEYNLTYGRDVAGLDVLGYTANDFNITESNWNKAVALTRDLHEEGAFVCFPGTEWCGNSCAGGDHNVVFLHDRKPDFPFTRDGRSARSFEWNSEMHAQTIEPSVWPLEHLWDLYAADPEGHLLIPHVGGRRANLDWHDPALERLIEVSSAWGHFDWFYQDAISRGYKLGASAAGDEHRGRCGGGASGAAVFGVKGGLTGIVSPSLTRKDIGAALRARHTWATTGERAVALLSCGASVQGDDVRSVGAARLDYRLLGSAPWDHIAAHDHNGIFWERNLQQEAGFSSRRFRFRWGGARIRDRYRGAQWSGQIRITNAIIHAIAPHGFDHPEERARRVGATDILFHSETYGDADAIEVELTGLANASISIAGTIGEYTKIGDASLHSPFAHCPSFDWSVTGAELLSAGAVRRELGGEGLFIALERIAEPGLPLEATGSIDVKPENSPYGFRPVYLSARQVDQERVWTSPLFISFVE